MNNKMFKLVWLRAPLSQTSLKIIFLLLCLFCLFFLCVVCFLCSCAALRRCAPLRSAPLICSALRCAELRCAALSFGVLARTPLSPGLELSGGLASKGEI